MGNADQKPKPVLRWSIRANAGASWPILAAIVGLVYGILVLRACEQFHGLYLPGKRPLVQTLLRDRETFLREQITRLTPLAAEQGKDSAAFRDTLDKYVQLQRQTIVDSGRLAYGNADTSLAYYRSFITADRAIWLRAIRENRDTVVVWLGDSTGAAYAPDALKKAILLIDRQPQGLIDFFDDNTDFGFWFLLSIAQMSMWFMLGVLIIGSAGGTNNIVKEFPYNGRNGILISLMPLAIIVIFTIILYLQLINGPVIGDKYFMNGFNLRMYFYSIPGYILVVIAFGVYLFLANKLELLNDPACQGGKTQADVTIEYQRLTSAFNFVFNCTAVILSIFVLWLGVLFSSVNNLEAARFYTLSSGKQLLNYDFVYLMGIVHSLLLAIFYFPVKLQFNALKLTKDDKAADADSPGMGKYFKTFGDILGSILVTASPLIATVVQKLFSGLLGN